LFLFVIVKLRARVLSQSDLRNGGKVDNEK
jgi:hypothetical protein